MIFTDGELLKALENNEAECFSTFQAISPSVSIDNAGDGTVIVTRVPFWLFNGVFRVRWAAGEVEGQIEKWLKLFEGHKLPFGLFLYPHSVSHEAENLLSSKGFRSESSTCVMFDSDLLEKMNIPKLDSVFEISAIRNAQQFAAFSSCWSKIFQVPSFIETAFRTWSENYGFKASLPLQNIAIFEGQRAVAIASYYLDENVAGIYNIGVDSEYRLRGLGMQIAKKNS